MKQSFVDVVKYSSTSRKLSFKYGIVAWAFLVLGNLPFDSAAFQLPFSTRRVHGDVRHPTTSLYAAQDTKKLLEETKSSLVRQVGPTAKKRLATAVEELVQAALSETISANQLVGKEAAQDIKKLVEETKALAGQVGAAKESSDAKLNTATQRLLDLERKVSSIESDLSSIEEVIADMDKARRIEWAVDHVRSIKIPGRFSIPGFEKYPAEERMSEFLLDVLLRFRAGQGRYIPAEAYHYEDGTESFIPHTPSPIEDQTVEDMHRLRETVQTHLHTLLGVEPDILYADL